MKGTRREYSDWYNFGKRVKSYRKRLGLTVEKLADMIDRTENYINRLEKGDNSCSVHTIHQLSQALRVPTDVLLYGSESMKEKDEYSDREIIINVVNSCNNEELQVIKDLMLAVFPKFKDILKK